MDLQWRRWVIMKISRFSHAKWFSSWFNALATLNDTNVMWKFLVNSMTHLLIITSFFFFLKRHKSNTQIHSKRGNKCVIQSSTKGVCMNVCCRRRWSFPWNLMSIPNYSTYTKCVHRWLARKHTHHTFDRCKFIDGRTVAVVSRLIKKMEFFNRTDKISFEGIDLGGA